MAGDGLLSLLGRLLDYMTTPWKAMVILVFVLVLGLGWIVWEQRTPILEALLQSPDRLNLLQLPQALADLQTETDADLIGIWTASVTYSDEEFLAGRRRDGSSWAFKPRRAPMFSGATPGRIIVELLAGNRVCADSKDAVSLLARAFRTEGMVRSCLVPVGVGDDRAVVALGWKNRLPDDVEEAHLRAAAVVAQRDLIR